MRHIQLRRLHRLPEGRNSEGAVSSGMQSGYSTPDGPALELLDACVRCGACVQSCPTHQQLGTEGDNPRGRVFLIRAVHNGRLELNEAFSDHIYGCLDCRACETVCPMGVQVGRLVEEARGEIRNSQPSSKSNARVTDFALRRIFPNTRLFEVGSAAVSIARQAGLQRLARLTGIWRLLPQQIRRMADALRPWPVISARRSLRRSREKEPKAGTRGTVGLFHGCVMNTLFADVTVATGRVLERNGWQVTVPERQACCGALHVHEGLREEGKRLARRNIAAFEASGAEYLIANSAGCSSALREYATLLRNDDAWRDRAERFEKCVRDVSEFLVEQGFTPPRGRVEARVTYQDACHLAHAQGIRSQPRALLSSIPGLELVEMKDPDRCCGSAGLYNLRYPEMSQSLLDRKLADIPERVGFLATANPGCHMHIERGLHEMGSAVRVKHVVELLDEAYGAGEGA